MNIAVLGGRFDPPHIGHLWIAKQVLEKRRDIDELWFVPAYQHQWKPAIASAKDRFHMLQTFQANDIKISDIEIKRKGISYSLDTIKEIKQMYGHEVFWIVGSDILHEFDRWEKTDDLTTLATFFVFPRDPYHIPTQLPKGFEVITGTDLITTNLSSTTIRNRIKLGKSIAGFVTKEVEDYIKKHKLYT